MCLFFSKSQDFVRSTTGGPIYLVFRHTCIRHLAFYALVQSYLSSSISVSPSYVTLFFPLQVIVLPPPAVGIAVLLTTLTCMYSEGTTPIMMSQEAQRMKTIHCSGSSGGTTLPQAAGSRFEQRAICPQSWRLCQVKCCI